MARKSKAQRQNPNALRAVKTKAKRGERLKAREFDLLKGRPLSGPSSNKPAGVSGVKSKELKIKPKRSSRKPGQRANNFLDNNRRR